MDRTALRSRLRDILVEEGTETYDDTYLDNWLDISYGFLCSIAAELDRSYFLTSTNGVSYAASTNDINIACLVGDETGSPTPGEPFRIIDIYDESSGTAPEDAVRYRAGPWEEWDNSADDAVWLFTDHMRIGLRPRPGSAKTLRIWWQDVPDGFSARPARCAITCVGADNIITTETFGLHQASGAAVNTFTFTLAASTAADATSATVVSYRANYTAADMARAVAAAVDANTSFTAYAIGNLVIVEQATAGVAGNRENTDTVANATFAVTAFSGGRDATNVVLGIPRQFHPLVAYEAAVMMKEHEESVYSGLERRADRWMTKYINFLQHRQKANPGVIVGGGASYGGRR